MSNAINPEHYNRLNPQPKDVIRAWGLNFNLGSAVKSVSFVRKSIEYTYGGKTEVNNENRRCRI